MAGRRAAGPSRVRPGPLRRRRRCPAAGEGPLCAACAIGYYKTSSGHCLVCDANAQAAGFGGVASLLLLIVVVVVLAYRASKAKRAAEKPETDKIKEQETRKKAKEDKYKFYEANHKKSREQAAEEARQRAKDYENGYDYDSEKRDLLIIAGLILTLAFLTFIVGPSLS